SDNLANASEPIKPPGKPNNIINILDEKGEILCGSD
ncbi:unnamed protein product, partial [marine sediment metagenome]